VSNRFGVIYGNDDEHFKPDPAVKHRWVEPPGGICTRSNVHQYMTSRRNDAAHHLICNAAAECCKEGRAARAGGLSGSTIERQLLPQRRGDHECERSDSQSLSGTNERVRRLQDIVYLQVVKHGRGLDLSVVLDTFISTVPKT
jgi:hypothetical protein